MSVEQRSGLKTFETAGVPVSLQEIIPNSLSGIYLFRPPMEHQNNAKFSSVGEDSLFQTNNMVNPFQIPDNLSGHLVLKEGKSCASSHSRSTSGFQNFFQCQLISICRNQLTFSSCTQFQSARKDLIW